MPDLLGPASITATTAYIAQHSDIFGLECALSSVFQKATQMVLIHDSL